MARASTSRRTVFARALGGALVAAIAFATYLRFSDGPVLVFPGGPLRTGERVAFDAVDWRALDGLRELELEVVRTSRSRILWFSVFEGRPYLSCGFGCAGGWPERWPSHIDRDDRVVLRLDGRRIEARLERVPDDTAEYAAARSARSQKFGGSGGARDAAEREAADSIARFGRAVSRAPQGRLYRVVSREAAPAG